MSAIHKYRQRLNQDANKLVLHCTTETIEVPYMGLMVNTDVAYIPLDALLPTLYISNLPKVVPLPTISTSVPSIATPT